MNRFFKKLFLLAAVALTASAASAQMGPVPVDKDVRIGKLDNGLTYYIRHNETPKGQADFHIAQRVGSALEEENQRGLAHFLEHMCFNGTESFPGNTIIDWLETKGVKFGRDLNAITGVDQTVYRITNVPITNNAVQDSCLLILHDWADALLLEPEEIDKERGVIHQEWRTTNVGQMRILENLLPVIYPDNVYGHRLPIGTMEVVDNFPYQALRDYYEAWYRPDNQGIIVVGDIDVDYIEGKIKEIFGPIKMPENPKERVYFPVADTPGTIFAIGSDPEQTVGVMRLMFKNDPIPDEAKNDQQYLMMQYVVRMITNMLNQRLNDLQMKPDAPFAQAAVNYGEFLVAKTKDALELIVVAKDDDILPGFEAAYRELLRAVRGGFTSTEYDRARSEYLSRFEKIYNGRDKRVSGAYAQEYIQNYLDNVPIPSIEDEYAIMQGLANMLPVEVINAILPQLISNDNRVLLAMLPENDTFKVPTQQEYEAIIAAVDAENIEAYVDEVNTDPLIPVLPAPGKVVSVADDAQWGTKVLTLSNGVKVVVKTTDFKKDEILFGAQAIGGSSSIPDDQANDLIVLPIMLQANGLGTYKNSDLEKYLKGKQAQIGLNISEYDRTIEGSSTVKDLPTLMELIYATFTSYNIDADEYASMQNMIASVLANQESNPEYIFSKYLQETLFKSPAKHTLTSDVVKAANRENIVKIAHDAMQNAADYTFYFVGDVDVETLTPLLEQYIATLPAIAENATKDYVKNPDRSVAPGETVKEFTTKMSTPQTWCCILSVGNMPYNIKNRFIISIASQILSNRLLKKIREEMGAVYSIGAVGDMSRLGVYNTVLQIPFPMKPEMKDQVLAEINTMLQGMTENVTDAELDPIKEYMVKTFIENTEKNNAWLGAMQGAQINGVDTFNGNVDAVKSITIDDVMNFMKEFMAQGNHKTIILDPAE